MSRQGRAEHAVPGGARVAGVADLAADADDGLDGPGVADGPALADVGPADADANAATDDGVSFVD